MCVCACVRACVRVCVRACVRDLLLAQLQNKVDIPTDSVSLALFV